MKTKCLALAAISSLAIWATAQWIVAFEDDYKAKREWSVVQAAEMLGRDGIRRSDTWTRLPTRNG